MLRNSHAGAVPGRRAVLTAFLVLSSLFVLNLTAETAEAGPGWAKGRILVAPRDGVSPAAFDSAVRGRGGRLLRRLKRLGVHEIEVPAWAERRIVRLLRRHPNIKFAELDVAVPLQAVTPNDTKYSSDVITPVDIEPVRPSCCRWFIFEDKALIANDIEEPYISQPGI